MSEKNYYDILLVDPEATLDEIKSSYRKLARRYHPDSSGRLTRDEIASGINFNDITEAYDILSHTEKRKEFDEQNAWVFKDRPRRESKPKSDGTGGMSGPDIQRAFRDAAQASRAGGGLRQTTFNSPEAWQRLREATSESQDADSESVLSSKRFFTEETLRESFGSMNQSAKKSAVERFREGILAMFTKKTDEENAETAEGQEAAEADAAAKPQVVITPGAVAEKLRGEREYQFTITTVEALHGCSREIAVDSGNGARSVSIDIPAGVRHRQVLRAEAFIPEDKIRKEFNVRIVVKAHPFVEFDENDIVVKLPITIGEAVNGAEIEVPTMTGLVKVSLPSGWSVEKRLRIKGHGLPEVGGQSRGDLFLRTFVVTPDQVNDAVKAAARAMDTAYSTPPRAHIPKSLLDLVD